MKTSVSELWSLISSLSYADKIQLIQLVVAQLAQDAGVDFQENLEVLESRSKKSLRGCLRQYANPALIEQEQGVWQTVAGEKYEHR